jgi:hypothetical protein
MDTETAEAVLLGLADPLKLSWNEARWSADGHGLNKASYTITYDWMGKPAGWDCYIGFFEFGPKSHSREEAMANCEYHYNYGKWPTLP